MLSPAGLTMTSVGSKARHEVDYNAVTSRFDDDVCWVATQT
jgi:hypothetical protein